MTLEKVSDLLSGHGEVLAVARLEKLEVVVECAESFHISVDGAIEICEVDLRDLVLPLQLQFVLQADDVLEELGEFEPRAFGQAQIWLKRVPDITFSHPSVHVGLELRILRFDKVKEVCVPHLLHSVLRVDWELPLHR